MEARVYPVPFLPNNSSSDDGVPYTAGNPNSGIIFDNLTSEATIKIYTLGGERVARFGSSNTFGRLQWDVKNEKGEDVASGGYLAVISSPNSLSVVKKILVVR